MAKLLDFLDNQKTAALKEWQAFENSPALLGANSFYDRLERDVKKMFGYPANRVNISAATQYLLLLHYTAPFSNNCGDVNERGNYALDSKDVEKLILRAFAEKFGMGENHWGYVTSGGTESNSCGIASAFAKYPSGVLYYSQSAHYSIGKAAKLYKHLEIPTKGKDVMDKEALFAAILKNYESLRLPANIVLTHGTTQFGECDDTDAVVAFLRQHKIPYYLHVDAALFGGIPNNQTDAPLIVNAKEKGIHSICVSLHKYLGFPDVHSVFVSTEAPYGEKIEYIGQRDTTVSGSRSIPSYALYNHVLEQLNETDPLRYSRNVHLFSEMLTKRNIPFYRAEKSNIFVIDEPSSAVCKEFQLSCFHENHADGTHSKKAHIIIFPCHTEENMQALADSL